MATASGRRPDPSPAAANTGRRQRDEQVLHPARPLAGAARSWPTTVPPTPSSAATANAARPLEGVATRILFNASPPHDAPMTQIISPLAGKPAPRSSLVDIPKLVSAYY